MEITQKPDNDEDEDANGSFRSIGELANVIIYKLKKDRQVCYVSSNDSRERGHLKLYRP